MKISGEMTDTKVMSIDRMTKGDCYDKVPERGTYPIQRR